MNYFEELGLNPNASRQDTIDELNALRKKWNSRLNAPTLEKKQEAELKLKYIDEALDIFSDYAKAAKYKREILGSIDIVDNGGKSNIDDIKEKIEKEIGHNINIPKIDTSKIDVNKLKNSNLLNKKTLTIIVTVLVIVLVLSSAFKIISRFTNDNSNNGVQDTLNEDYTQDKNKEVLGGKAIHFYDYQVEDEKSNGFGFEENRINTFGEELNNVNYLGEGSYNSDQAFVTIINNGNYNNFTANISLDSESNTSGYFWIYANDKEDEPIYELFIDRLTEITNVNIDVSKYDSFTISYKKDDWNNSYVLLSDAYLYKENGLENLSLSAIKDIDFDEVENINNMTMVEHINAKNGEETVINSLGEKFDSYVLLGTGSYNSEKSEAIYYINDKFKKLTANISSLEDTSTNCNFEILVDDELVYSDSINRYTETHNIEIDISGGKFLTLKFDKENSSSGYAILSDVLLYKSSSHSNDSIAKLPDYSQCDNLKITSAYMVNSENASNKEKINDINGNPFTHSLVLSIGSYEKNAFATYYLHKDYKKLSGLVSILEESETSFDLTIYGDLDENNVLYSTRKNVDSQSETIDINVEDLTFITIMISNKSGYNECGILMSDTYFNVE